MKTQRRCAAQIQDAARLQVDFRERPGDRPRHGEQTLGRVDARVCRAVAMTMIARNEPARIARQRQEPPRLVSHLAERGQAARQADQVEQVGADARIAARRLAGEAELPDGVRLGDRLMGRFDQGVDAREQHGCPVAEFLAERLLGAQGLLGDLVYVDLPSAGRSVAAGEACAVVESVKAASDVYAPLAGEVVESNEALTGSPEAVNEDAYAAWLFRLRPTDAAAIDTFLDAAAYSKLIAEAS